MFNRNKSDGVQNPEVGDGVQPGAPNTEVTGKTQAELLAEGLSVALKPLSDALGEMRSKQEAFEARFNKPKEEVEQRTQFASVFEDEDAAIGQRVVAAVGPLYQQQLETQAELNREKVMREFEGKGFGPTLEKFSTRINQLLDGTPLVRQDGKPWRGEKEYIRNTINMVIGEAASQAGLRFDPKGGNFFIEGANGGDGSSSSAQPVDGLNEGQRRIFNRMKVTPADAQKTISKLKFVN